jgi:hypothetical protein
MSYDLSKTHLSLMSKNIEVPLMPARKRGMLCAYTQWRWYICYGVVVLFVLLGWDILHDWFFFWFLARIYSQTNLLTLLKFIIQQLYPKPYHYDVARPHYSDFQCAPGAVRSVQRPPTQGLTTWPSLLGRRFWSRGATTCPSSGGKRYDRRTLHGPYSAWSTLKI